MSTFKAAVIPSPGAAVEVREIPEPPLEPGEALLQVDLSEVCGTDVHLQAGRLAETPYPFIPGHVSVGRLGKIRGSLRDVDGKPLAEGDAVTFLDVHRTCNACWHCLVARASTRCPQRKVYGITYGLEDGLTGGWAEAIHLKAGTHCLRLEGVDPERFMAGGCALPTALHAVQRAEITLGDTVLVLGSGPVGLSAIILARLQGAARVLCIGAPALRLQTAAEAGASDTLDIESSSEAQRFEWVRGHTGGRGADVTIEATGAPVAAVQAMRWTRDAGRAVIVGQYTDHGEVPFNPHLDLNKKHLEVRGCWGSDFSHFYRGVQLMANPDSSRPWSVLSLKRYGLHQANEALAEVAAGRAIKALIDSCSLMSLLRFQDVAKSYGETRALDGVSLEVQQGEVFGLLGPNGAGKTTLIRILMDIIRPDSGSLWLFGESHRRSHLDRVGYLPEERGLYTKQKVLEVMTYFGNLKGLRRAEARRLSLAALERMDLAETAGWQVERLSKGMSQKVQIASMLLNDPELCVMDEPFSGLDPMNVRLVQDLIQERRAAGRTTILSTHQMNQVETLCDRVALIHKGRLVVYGEVQEVRERHSQAEVRVRMDGEFPAMPGVERAMHERNGSWRLLLEDGTQPRELLRQLVDSGAHVDGFERILTPMEDIFIHVVQEAGS